MYKSGTHALEVGSLLTTESLRRAAPPDWALRVSELIELLTEAKEKNEWQLVNETLALLENMQAELDNELMEAA
jgi:hypothetical protein